MWQTLKKLWAGWKRVAHTIGDFQARALLTVVYAVLVLPFGLVVRCCSDFLTTKKRPRVWLDYPQHANDLKSARQQG